VPFVPVLFSLLMWVKKEEASEEKSGIAVSKVRSIQSSLETGGSAIFGTDMTMSVEHTLLH
jgi:hypothetical protein